MVDFKKLTGAVTDNLDEVKEKAEGLLDGRGGMDTLKEDLAEIKDIVTGEGSITDKAKAAVDALKHPGAHDEAPAEEG